jgi:biopolymer transport protein ExbD
MAKEVNLEEFSMDMTPMIDVVFLLIIFFILMPPKEMEGQLQSYLPNDSSAPPPPNQEQPPPKFTITISSKKINTEEIETNVSFNSRPVCQFVTYSLDALNKIYSLPNSEKSEKLDKEYKRDEGQFDPNFSSDIKLLIKRMEDAAIGSPDGNETDVIIDAAPNVPFKIILAILNAGAGADFPNLKFSAPSQDIWKQE